MNNVKKSGREIFFKVLKLLYVLVVVSMLYLPVIFIVIESFNSNTGDYSFGSVTFEWYEKMFNKEGFRDAVFTTFSITVISTLVSTVLGTLFAIGINSLSRKKKQAVITFNNIPILNADIVSAIFLFIIFQTFGAIIGVEHPLGNTTLLLAHIFFSLPYVVLSVLPKLREIDVNLFDAALDLGCSPRKALLKVIVPAVAGGIFSGAVLAFTMSIDDFTISYFVSGADVENLSIWINNIRTIRYGKLQIASAFYTIFTLVMFVILIVYNIISSRKKVSK